MQNQDGDRDEMSAVCDSHVADHILHLLHCQRPFVNEIHLLGRYAELPQAVEWLAISQPAVVAVMGK